MSKKQALEFRNPFLGMTASAVLTVVTGCMSHMGGMGQITNQLAQRSVMGR